jgi:hypothetical protein
MKISFGCAANRKSQRLISTPTYITDAAEKASSNIPSSQESINQAGSLKPYRLYLAFERLTAGISVKPRGIMGETFRGFPQSLHSLVLVPTLAVLHYIRTTSSPLDLLFNPESKCNNVELTDIQQWFSKWAVPRDGARRGGAKGGSLWAHCSLIYD